MDSTSPLVIWLPPSVVNGFLDCRKPLNLSLSVVPPTAKEEKEVTDRIRKRREKKMENIVRMVKVKKKQATLH